MKTQCIDMHCDTLMKCYFDKAEDLFSLPGQVDLKRMHEAGAMAQFFAVYMPEDGFLKKMNLTGSYDDDSYIEGCCRIFENSMKAHSDIAAKAVTAAQIRENYARGLTSGVLTMEDGRAINGKLEKIKEYYDLGIRAISLTWNGINCLGYPNSADEKIMKAGLTPFGKEAVQYMQELGILVDVSHLSDGGFFDVADICRKPFVATHSNARALAPHRRNLTDEQLRMLAKNGGVTGLNVFGPFLNSDTSDDHSTVEAMVKHVCHIADVAGIDTIAMGSDFDGVFGTLDMEDVTQLPKLIDGLKKSSFSEDTIEKFLFGNVLRVMDESVK